MFGEIHLCEFPFTSGAAGKVRPALALFDLQQDVIICRITGILRSGPLDVALRDWQSAGLLKPSIARLDRIVTAEKTIFLRRLGVLSPTDAQAVRETWNRLMKL
jgi:mRNA interferase MazF